MENVIRRIGATTKYALGANGPYASYVFIWGHPVKQRIKIKQFKSLATANRRHITTHSAASILELQAEFE